MYKRLVLIIAIACICNLAKAQTADKVYDKYLDFNLARAHGDLPKTLNLGEALLPDADKLPAKSRVAFYNSIAKAFEDSNQDVKAIHYYELVSAAEPDYYVAHRALGFFYLKAVNPLVTKLNATTDKAEREKVLTAYKAAIRKALLHLEKAQACDPDDKTLKIITNLYKNLDDKQATATLNARLAEQAKKCLDILVDN